MRTSNINTVKLLTIYWAFGFLSIFGILENRKHDVSETGPVSVLR
jgi:hypothetical protein